MTEEHAAQRLAKQIGRLEDETRQLKKLIVQKYGTPWWKARSEDIDFDHFYACMLAKTRGMSNEARAERAKHVSSPK